MEGTLDRALPHNINSFEGFMASKTPALLDCSHCVVDVPGKASIVHRKCEQTISSGGTRCDHCKASHLACDGSFLDKDRLLWLLAKFFREHECPEFESVPGTPLIGEEVFLPGSPIFLPQSPPPLLPADFIHEEDAVPALNLDEVDELTDDQQDTGPHELGAGLAGLYGDDLDPLVLEFLLQEDIRELIAAAPEAGTTPDYPIVVE